MDIKNMSDIKELLEAVAAADITEFNLKDGDFSLKIKKGGTPLPVEAPQISWSVPTTQPVPSGMAAPAQPSAEPGESEPKYEGQEICSPMVGTFYRSPSPDSAPFVQTGDEVELGQTLCIIEAMKLMNEIEAEQSGRIVKVFVENGQPVEFGQPLFLLEPVS